MRRRKRKGKRDSEFNLRKKYLKEGYKPLSEIDEGKCGRIIGIDFEKYARPEKLLSLGFAYETPFKVLKNNGTLLVHLKESRIGLGKILAESIFVEPAECENNKTQQT